MNKDDDLRQAAFLLLTVYVSAWHADHLSMALSDDIADLLQKPRIRKMLKGAKYWTADPKGAKAALRSLGL